METETDKIIKELLGAIFFFGFIFFCRRFNMSNEMRRGSALYQIMCMKEHQLYLGEDENPLLEPIAYELANCENLDFDKIELAVALLCISVFKQKDDEGVVDIEGMMSGLKNG